ncbi:MAG: hypothetical protein AB8B53_06540 [Flavobacteriales bacterium]
MNQSNQSIKPNFSYEVNSGKENISQEQFHPISWLQSVGQFLGEELNNNYLVSTEGIESVKAAVV